MTLAWAAMKNAGSVDICRGLRLSIYIFRRHRGKPEDYRYQAFRQHFGPERHWWVSL